MVADVEPQNILLELWHQQILQRDGTAFEQEANKTYRLKTRPAGHGHVLTTQLSIDDSVYQTQLLYAPTTPAAGPPFFDSLVDYLFTDGGIILAGDFNMVEGTSIDRAGGTTQSAHTNSLAELHQLKQGNLR